MTGSPRPFLLGVRVAAPLLEGAPAAESDEHAGPDAFGGLDGFVRAARLADESGLSYVAVAEGGFATMAGPELAAYLARKTVQTGILSSAESHYAEPFHVAKAAATLDFVSGGRAGLEVRAARSPQLDAAFPAALPLELDELAEQGAEFVAVVRELWDSWEDGAELRDAPSGRYLDSAKLHHIAHAGPYFTVRGPLITPRPPQGQPPIVVSVTAADMFAAGPARLAFLLSADALLLPDLPQTAAGSAVVAASSVAAFAARLAAAAAAAAASSAAAVVDSGYRMPALLIQLADDAVGASADPRTTGFHDAEDAAADPRTDGLHDASARPASHAVARALALLDEGTVTGVEFASAAQLAAALTHPDWPALAAAVTATAAPAPAPAEPSTAAATLGGPQTLRERFALGRPASRYSR
ncbi:LLM class flavin-dependent oxidoreductase [Subtercola vilae]|uniref:LLM class flavin-dependent oxidoreductase n=1 Tax=Subtercola vilae TaxID=2056433 RepID=A0A4T2BUY7_9MICO|nr:LLM class flavin-dependent oxidoreductase [Subtercola vilae]TIH34822.1 LLM class flavin-dependent oxidoreductase [Subtercola vilae]